MSRKIIGVTVGTPTSPSKIEKELKPVKKVNGVEPDENGNVNVEIPKVDLTGYTIVDNAKGSVISLSDSSDRELRGLKIFGKTTQNGTPTPDAPVPLESVGDSGSLGVTVFGKNLVTTSDVFALNGMDDVSITEAGNKITIHNLGYADGVCFGLGLLKKGKTYSISGNAVNHINLRIYNVNDFKNSLYSISTDANGNFNIEYTPNTENQVFRVWIGDFKTCVLTDFQIAIKTADNSYELPARQPLTVQKPEEVPVLLPGIPVSSGGNYTDENGQQWICDEVDFVSGKYVQRIATKVLNGAEEWSRTTNDPNPCFSTYIKAKSSYPAKCSHFTHRNYPYLVPNTTGIFGWESTFTVANFASEFTTVNDWKSWLQANPVTVEYVIETPIKHDLSAEELAQYAALHTNYPSTTIFNDGGADMAVKYVADTKSYIDKKFAELAAAIVNS